MLLACRGSGREIFLDLKRAEKRAEIPRRKQDGRRYWIGFRRDYDSLDDRNGWRTRQNVVCRYPIEHFLKSRAFYDP